MAPTAIQKQIYQMLPLDLTLFGIFERELVFGWGKKKKVVSHLLSEKLREGKGGGKRGRGRENIAVIIRIFIYLYIYLHAQFKIFWTMFGKIQDFLDLQQKAK